MTSTATSDESLAPIASVTPPGAGTVRLWFVLVLAITFLPPFIGAHFRDSRHTMENVALVSSQETWLRWHEHTENPLITYNDDLPRYEKPPLLTWLDMMAWADLDPYPPDPDKLVLRAREVAVLLGSLCIVSIFWIGCTIRGPRLGALAAMVAGSMFFLQRQSQTASYDIHFTAWATFAVAAGFALVRSRTFRSKSDSLLSVSASSAELQATAPKWKLILTVLAVGGATFAAVMSKNPLAYILILPPVIAYIVSRTAPRVAAYRSFLLTVLAASIPVVAWYVYVRFTVPDSAYHLEKEFTQLRSDPQPWYYYVGLLGLVAPWTIWLIGGLLHPFARQASSSPVSRRALKAVFFWFCFILFFFSLWEAKQQRYILPIIPPAALLIAWVWLDHDNSSAALPEHRCQPWVIALHWIILLCSSFLFAAFCVFQHRIQPLIASAQRFITDHNWQNSKILSLLHLNDSAFEPVVHPLPSMLGIALLALLLLCVISGWRAHRAGRSACACVCTSLWAIVLTTTFWVLYGLGPDAGHPLRPVIREFSAYVGEAPVRSFIHLDDDDEKKGLLAKPMYRLNEEFRFYYGRLIHRINADELAEYAQSNQTVYVLTKSSPSFAKPLQAAGFTLDHPVQTDIHEYLDLWVHHPSQ
ncbi:MAG TPA: hypothetical protein VG711_03400 [Phycisphaerales bacterium]|nr:hypothetical protein [Phycisphaerales bacterium]